MVFVVVHPTSQCLAVCVQCYYKCMYFVRASEKRPIISVGDDDETYREALDLYPRLAPKRCSSPVCWGWWWWWRSSVCVKGLSVVLEPSHHTSTH